ncbi:MAG: IS4 family transposase [Gemmataceae bacterium]
MDAMQTTGVSFGQRHFGSADLGDRRRTRRLIRVADQLVSHPAGTFPHKIPNPYERDAFYALMAADAVTHAAVMQPHFQLTHQRMAAHAGTVLIVHDSTILDYSGLNIPQLGQVGEGHGRGYYGHNSLAITSDRRVLGLAQQILHSRRQVPAHETRRQGHDHPQRESRLWRDAVAALPPAAAGQRQVDVADRAADLMEFLDYEQEHDRSYVVRSQHNRWVFLQVNGRQQRRKLHQLTRSLAAVCGREVKVSAQAKQPARTAWLSLAWVAVQIVPPRQPRGDERSVPLPVWVLRAWEEKPPPGVEPLAWILLSNVAVTDAAAALERLDWYCRRVVIEEFHKAQKTGCDIERMQFEQAARLEPAIGLVSVVALTLLQLRDAGRDAETAGQPATLWVPTLWVQLLASWRYQDAQRALTLREFLWTLARLGGHQNRPSDGAPGWQTLWRGWTQLQAMIQGVRLAQSHNCGGT